MRSQLAVVLAILMTASTVRAQSEAEVLRYAEEGMAQVRTGQLTPLVFYKELFRRIQLTPSAEYPFKAENLRHMGHRIDIYEAVERGEITSEKAERLIAEQQAAWEQAEQGKRREAEESRNARARELERQQQEAEAHLEAQRRALALQILQQNRRAPVPMQPYQIPTPRQTNCTSQWIGSQLVTRCQ